MNQFVAILATVAALTPAVSAHGYIKLWGLQGSNLERAQKSDLKSSSFRSAPDNTGWIGSNFLTSAAITCGSSQTPFQTVASPGGTIFSSAAQSAGRELAVKPGQSVQFVVSGNPGQGWPHPRGHVQAYLASCGGSCTNFDASKGKFFKIHQELHGIENTLRPAYDGGVDGNRYNVKIPASIPDGSYILRYELIAFGQSSGIEGQQDQYYPFCGQINVSGGSGRPNSAQLATVGFPGAYKNGKINENTLPGPAVLAGGSTSVSGGSSSPGGKTTSSGGKTTSSSGKTGTKGSASVTPSSGQITLGSKAPACAAMCLRVKISEHGSLAPSCNSNDGACLCSQKSTFVQAFYNCAKDHCSGSELTKARKLFDASCSALEDDGDDEDCEEEETKRDLEEVERELERVRKEREVVEKKKRDLKLKRALKKMSLEERFPAPGHGVVKPLVRSTIPLAISNVSAVKGKREVRHGAGIHGKRMVKTRKTLVIKRS